MHHSHENQYCQQKYRIQKRTDMVRQKPEHRRHKAGPYIGGRHLHPDYSLRLIRPEMRRRGMYDGWVNGRASQTGNDQSSQSSYLSKRKEQEHDAAQDQPLPQPYHPGII